MLVLKDKVVVITGGAGRLGRTFCDAVARAGGIAIMADRDEPTAKEVIAGFGSDRISFEYLDITRASSVDDCIQNCIGRYGRVDALVNNAYPRNAAYGREFFRVEYQDFLENVGTHLGGYFLCAQRFADHFRHSKRGSIINIASIYGVMAPRFEIYSGTSMTMPVEYAVVKAGILHLTRYMAQFLRKDGIRVNAISPGGIEAGQPEPFQDAYRSHCGQLGMLKASDVSGTLVFLLSDESLAITGQNIIVDDGFTL